MPASQNDDHRDLGLGSALRVVFYLVALYLIVAIAARSWPGTPSERALVARMSAMPPAVRGRDGGDLIWLHDYDLPVASRHAAASRIRAFIDAHPDAPDPEKLPNFPGNALPALPPAPGQESALCGRDVPDCLAYARLHPAEIDALLVVHRKRVALAREAASFDGIRVGIQPGWFKPVPSYSGGHALLVTALSRQFTSGDQAGALSGLCSDLDGWRRIDGDLDTVVGSLISLGVVRRDLELFASMLAEWPARAPLPASCPNALRPVADAEVDSCPMTRGEFRFQVAYHTDTSAGLPWDGWMKTMDRRAILRRYARSFSAICSAGAIADARADRSLAARLATHSMRCGAFQSAVDPAGCLFTEVASDGWHRYPDRRTDAAQLVGLARTLAWLHAQPEPRSAWPALLARRPASLGLVRQPRIAADGRSIVLPLRSDWRNEATFALRPPGATPP